MKYYWIPGQRQYVSTKKEASDLKVPYELKEVPTDHDGLKEVLNGLHRTIVTLAKKNAELTEKLRPAEDGGTVEIATADMRDDKGGEPSIKHKVPAPKEMSYSERTVLTDEMFLALPVPQQLTLATLALENARKAFPKPAPLVIESKD